MHRNKKRLDHVWIIEEHFSEDVEAEYFVEAIDVLKTREAARNCLEDLRSYNPRGHYKIVKYYHQWDDKEYC